MISINFLQPIYINYWQTTRLKIPDKRNFHKMSDNYFNVTRQHSMYASTQFWKTLKQTILWWNIVVYITEVATCIWLFIGVVSPLEIAHNIRTCTLKTWWDFSNNLISNCSNYWYVRLEVCRKDEYFLKVV